MDNLERIDRTNHLLKKMSEDADKRVLYRNQIVELNIRLVSHILKKYKPYTADQYQAGCVGLILAANAYNPDLKVPFHNFACFCIEREIQLYHLVQSSHFEELMKENLIYLNATRVLDNGDIVQQMDVIVDIRQEQEIEALLEEKALTNMFGRIVEPSLDLVVSRGKKYPSKADPEKWKNLELQYLIALCEDSPNQKDRITLSAIARALGITTTRAKGKHEQAIAAMRERCKVYGILPSEKSDNKDNSPESSD